MCSLGAAWQPPWENLVLRKRKLAGDHLCQLISSPDLICLSCPPPYLPASLKPLFWMWSHFYPCFISFGRETGRQMKQERQAANSERSNLPERCSYDLQPTTKYFQVATSPKYCTNISPGLHQICCSCRRKGGKRGSCPSPLPPPPLGHILHTDATRLLFTPPPLHYTAHHPHPMIHPNSGQSHIQMLLSRQSSKLCQFLFVGILSSGLKARRQQWQLRAP